MDSDYEINNGENSFSIKELEVFKYYKIYFGAKILM